MLDQIILPPSNPDDLADSARALLAQQRSNWDALAAGYASLASVQSRTIDLDNFTIKLQFNPGRITSSAAKVDPKSIANRKCFLCPANLPPAQRGLLFQDNYLILCNPFPIFPEHFTIPHKDHIPQQIATSFPAFLDLAKALQPRYTVFYNGPKCGASAPDHLHFQAGNKNFMLIEQEYDRLTHRAGRLLIQTPHLRAYAVDQSLRRFIALESPDRDALYDAFRAFDAAFRSTCTSADEPLMNILCSFDAGQWRVILFPRAKHRPSFFFAEGDDKILLSPASVDIGGVCITPVERDFHRITRDHLTQMFTECCLSAKAFSDLCSSFSPA